MKAPTLRERPGEWMRFAVARFFHGNMFGYERADFLALKAEEVRVREQKSRTKSRSRRLLSGSGVGGERRPLLGAESRRRSRPGSGHRAIGILGLREPNTFAYALCDSPVGLLSLVLSALRRRSPNHMLTHTEIIDVTQLAWLPGPEAGARLWAAALEEVEGWEDSSLSRTEGESEDGKAKKAKSNVAVTVFSSDGCDGPSYVCPAWASAHHTVLFSQRASGRPGIAPWESVDVLIEGIRGLAREVERVDPRLRIRALEEIVVFDEPIIEADVEDESERERESVDYSAWSGEGESEEGGEGHGMQLDVESPDTVVAVDMRREG